MRKRRLASKQGINRTTNLLARNLEQLSNQLGIVDQRKPQIRPIPGFKMIDKYADVLCMMKAHAQARNRPKWVSSLKTLLQESLMHVTGNTYAQCKVRVLVHGTIGMTDLKDDGEASFLDALPNMLRRIWTLNCLEPGPQMRTKHCEWDVRQ